MRPPLAAITAIASITLLASCADLPSGPSARLEPPQPALATSSAADVAGGDARAAKQAAPGERAGALSRTTPLPADLTHSFTVTQQGGTFAVPGTGLQVIVPHRAIISRQLTITVTAVAGSMVAYDFAPHGTVFLAPLTLVQERAGTNFARLADPARVRGAYFTDRSKLRLSRLDALVDELFPLRADLPPATLGFNVWHFSGYMLSTGRSDEQEGEGQ